MTLKYLRKVAKAHIAPILGSKLHDRDVSPFPLRGDFDLVGIGNFADGYLLAEHLIKLGARRIAFVTRHKNTEASEKGRPTPRRFHYINR